MMEEIIIQADLNTETRKFVTIGINADSQSAYVQDQDKYEFEGPKNLFDQDQVCDYFEKMVKEHPLLTYIEDPFAEGDFKGYQKITARF